LVDVLRQSAGGIGVGGSAEVGGLGLLKELEPKGRRATSRSAASRMHHGRPVGEKILKAAEGWYKASETLQPYTPILERLRNFMAS
jgi:hypothetical protein